MRTLLALFSFAALSKNNIDNAPTFKAASFTSSVQENPLKLLCYFIRYS
jgi:hypothetical protein